MRAKTSGQYLLRRNRVRCSLNDIQLALLDHLLSTGFYGQSRSEVIERILDRHFIETSKGDVALLSKLPKNPARHP